MTFSSIVTADGSATGAASTEVRLNHPPKLLNPEPTSSGCGEPADSSGGDDTPGEGVGSLGVVPVRPSSVPSPAKPDAIDLGAAAAADADAPAELRGDEVLDPASASGRTGFASSDGVGPLLAPAALLLDVAFRISVGSFMLHPDDFCGLTCAASSSSSMWSVGSGGSFTPFSRPVPKLAR